MARRCLAMMITRTQAFAMAIGLALLGVAMAKAGGSELGKGLIALPTKMEPKALARGDIVLVDPAAPVRKPIRRS